jgi:hypothetical protein
MSPRAAVVLATALALASGCSESGPAQAKEEILAADKAFSALSEKEGPKAAYLEYLVSDAKLLSVLPQGAEGVKAEFMPSFVDVSQSGDLGYTWGRYTLTVPMARRPLVQMGTYVTVWKRRGSGWKVVLDGGHPDGQK